MKSLFLQIFQISPMNILPTALIFSGAAQSFGLVSAHAEIFQLAFYALVILALKLTKGHSLFFAFQTVSGIASHRQVNAMKNYIPSPMRQQIEAGNFDYNQKNEVPMAVVGLVDMIGSTRISTRIGLRHDFELKKEFLKAAGARAKQYNVMILNHTGDGFLFFVNPSDSPTWKRDVASFYLDLTTDFKMILHRINLDSCQQIDSGLRFGVSCGTVMMGCLGASPAQYTAVGADVNLAARLCAAAAPNEIVFSESAWLEIKGVFTGVSKKFTSLKLKGFEKPMVGVHVRRNQLLAVSK